ncbi:MAG: hypothetical protein ABII00_05300 [Elusimicrobiota bacterium]
MADQAAMMGRASGDRGNWATSVADIIEAGKIEAWLDRSPGLIRDGLAREEWLDPAQVTVSRPSLT